MNLLSNLFGQKCDFPKFCTFFQILARIVCRARAAHMTPSLSLRKNHYVNAPLCLLFIVDLRRSSIWPHYFISYLISQTKSNEIVTTNMLFWGTHYYFFCKAQLFFIEGGGKVKLVFHANYLFISFLCVEILREIWAM